MKYGIKTLFLLFTLIAISGCARFTGTGKDRLHTIAFYNVEKLYDTESNQQNYDLDFTPDGALAWTQERYETKLKNLASVIETIGGKDGPAILGVSEVENRKVVEDLINTSPIRKRSYRIIHYDSPDPIGLDIALLYHEKHFSPTYHQTIPIEGQNKGKGTRAILQVKGQLQGEPITIFVNHWPANNGNQRLGQQLRQAAAATLRKQVEEILAADPHAKIIVMGDFDEVPSSPLLESTLRATGRPNPAYREELFNTFYMAHVQGEGSYFSRGRFHMLDQIMLSKSFLVGEGLQFVRGSATIHTPDFARHAYGRLKYTPKRTFSNTTYLGGYSDHFPVYIQLRKER